MSSPETTEPFKPDSSFRRQPKRQSLGLSEGETAHLCHATALTLAGLSERQLRIANENFFEFFDARHELLALQADQVERPPEVKAAPARLRAIGKRLAQNARGFQYTPLDKRLQWIVTTLSLDAVEAAILAAIVRVAMFDSWQQLAQAVPFKASNPNCELLALFTNLPLQEIDERLSPGSRLLSSGMVIDENDGEYCAARLLLRIARSHASDPLVLSQRLMPQAPASSLAWEDFAHIGPLCALSARVIASGEPVSILLHGRPGTGKTEFARLLADHTMRRAVFAGLADEQGGEPTRQERLSHLGLLRSMSKGTNDILVVVDEADDVLRMSNFPGHSGSKQWLNRLVEDPQVPTIWILNDPDELDPALLRRMTLAIAFDTPPIAARARIVARAAAAQELALSQSELADLATLDAEPAVIASGMHVARLSSGGAAEVRTGVESVLKALGHQRATAPAADACYDANFAAADCDLAELAERLVETPMRGWSMLLTGPSGTGKSAFARHLAARLGIAVEERRGSDLLGAYVGQTEKRIAEAFACAADRGAMLLIDEADSFLFRRDAGQRSWETGMVNEMLRWMEHLRAPFVATTNLADRLDPAMQRRFTLSVSFKCMSLRNAQTLFAARFGMSAPATLMEISGLTPGDFAVVHHRARLLGEISPEVLVKWLQSEVAFRGDNRRTAGFHMPAPKIDDTGCMAADVPSEQSLQTHPH